MFVKNGKHGNNRITFTFFSELFRDIDPLYYNRQLCPRFGIVGWAM